MRSAAALGADGPTGTGLRYSARGSRMRSGVFDISTGPGVGGACRSHWIWFGRSSRPRPAHAFGRSSVASAAVECRSAAPVSMTRTCLPLSELGCCSCGSLSDGDSCPRADAGTELAGRLASGGSGGSGSGEPRADRAVLIGLWLGGEARCCWLRRKRAGDKDVDWLSKFRRTRPGLDAVEEAPATASR